MSIIHICEGTEAVERVRQVCEQGIEAHQHVADYIGRCLPVAGDRCDLTAVYRNILRALESA